MTAPWWTRRDAVRALSASFVGMLLGCGRPNEATPPTIALGEDVCDWCRMTIDDARLAAAFVPASGPALRFGEPGCLLSWVAEHRGAAGTPFVTAQEDGGWLRAPEALYARGLVRTPMAFDLAAWRATPGPRGDGLTWSFLLAEGAPRATRG